MKRLACSVALAAALAFAGPALAQSQAQAAASFGHYEPAPEFDGMVSHSFYVRLRDGVRVAVRVDRPTLGGKVHEGPLPVIWHHSLSISLQTADGAGGRVSDYRKMPSLTRYGYVVVQVARRGNGQSFGAMRGYHDRNEAQDAFELIDWLSRQPWSNGKIGMYGCSNTGDAAMHALTMRPPALKAVFAGCFSWHKYDAFRRGGIFAQWGTGPTRSIEQDMKVSPVDGDEGRHLLAQAAREHQNSTPLFEMWKQLPYRDSFSPLVGSRFWAEGSAASYAEQIRLSGIPLYIQGGWHDELRDQGLIAQRNIPGARLLIGPWKHCNNDDFALLEEMHRFFDQHLKGIDTGLDEDAPIHYFTMHAAPGTEWRATDTWPLADTDPQRRFLAGEALAAEPGKAGSRQFRVRYDIECPDAGSGSQVQPCHVPGNGVSYAGGALKQPVEVTGYPAVTLWVASSATDANLFAYLEDVAPDGSVEVVTEGRLKASLRKEAQAPWKMPPGVPWHRAYAEDAQPLTPGTPVKLHFAMMPASYVFRPGHRIQITVTGSDHRERARTEAAPPSITVFEDAAHPSSVTLPVIP
ncbi:MAG TPA: CocE/NonD family hydrolase [Sphingomonas sp.]|nr:CocE/NonD family hydrolase [Sphingomonas sp.]